MLRALLLCLLLWAPALGQSEGMLVHLAPGEAELSGSQLIPLDHNAYRKLAERGLGSRWRIFVQNGRVDSALFLGMAPGVTEALSVLSRFIAAIDGSNWEGARQLLTPESLKGVTPAQFEAYWSVFYLSPERDDWRLDEPRGEQLTVRIAGSRSRGTRVGRSGYRAGTQNFSLALVHVAGGWRVSYTPP